MLGKLSYLARSILLFPFPSSSRCPNCDGAQTQELDRKFYFTRLVRCDDCHLMFRTPTESEAFNRRFYNHFYKEGITMELPSDADLASMKDRRFTGLWSDYAEYISFLERQGIRKGCRLFDFGCSWGYGSYQFSVAGIDTYSYEISRRRRSYGIEKLNVRHIDNPYTILPGHPLFQSFDCFFSAHVLEHVPSPSKVIELAWRCLKPGGAFVAFTPNGCEAYRRFNPKSWRNMWGAVHPNFIDEVFYERHFAHSRRVYGARDGSDVTKNSELGFVAWKGLREESF